MTSKSSTNYNFATQSLNHSSHDVPGTLYLTSLVLFDFYYSTEVTVSGNGTEIFCSDLVLTLDKGFSAGYIVQSTE